MNDDAHARVLARLNAANCRYRVHRHEPVVTAEDALDKVPELTRGLIKTVVFRIKGGGVVLAALPFQARISYKQMAEELGISRRALRSVAAAEVPGLVGCEPGGVGPVPLLDGIQVLFDRSVFEFDTINCGGGSNSHTLEIDPESLLRASGGKVADISAPE